MKKALLYVSHYVGMNHNAGGELSAHSIMRVLNKSGWETTVLLSEAQNFPSYTIDGVSVVVPQTADEARILPLTMIRDTDVLLTQLSAAMRGGLLGRRKLNTPVVHLVHNDHEFTRNMVETNTDVPVFNTEWIRDCFNMESWKPGIVVHPIVDPEEYRVETTGEFVTLINLSSGDGVHYDKGSSTFYELALRNPDIQFLGVKGAYGPQDIRDLPNVTIWEHQEDIREVYRRTKVLLVPSKYESYGRVAVEASCSGIPVIATPTAGLEEALGDSGAYAPYRGYDEWQKALTDVLSGFEGHSQKALERADHLWNQSELDIEDLLAMMNILYEGGAEGWRFVVSKT